jgi:hypothetical protein
MPIRPIRREEMAQAPRRFGMNSGFSPDSPKAAASINLFDSLQDDSIPYGDIVQQGTNAGFSADELSRLETIAAGYKRQKNNPVPGATDTATSYIDNYIQNKGTGGEFDSVLNNLKKTIAVRDTEIPYLTAAAGYEQNVNAPIELPIEEEFPLEQNVNAPIHAGKTQSPPNNDRIQRLLQILRNRK